MTSRHRRLCLLFAVAALSAGLRAQPLPKDSFRNPLDIDIGLSATFAEFRTNHFHAGIDMRTGGAIGQPVRAAADGYVAKVSISPWGGGKILYIKHPNGYTTVYMHLDSYAGDIGRAVLREQYARQSYSITKLFAPGELPVKQGQLVARSGNSGGSGSPHLHFEVRRGGEADLHTRATTINPLLFGLPYKDNIAPVIRGLRVYPVGGESFEVGKDNRVTVAGDFFLGIYATDAAEGSTAKNGPDKVEVYVDGGLFFEYNTREFPLDSSRMVNALLDYRRYVQTRQPYLLTRGLPGAEGPWVPTRKDGGMLRFAPGSTHKVQVRVYDVADNLAQRTITVAAAGTARTAQPEVKAEGYAVRHDRASLLRGKTFAVKLPAGTFYADDRLGVDSHGDTIDLHPLVNDLPPHKAYTIAIHRPGASRRNVIVRIDGKRRTACATLFRNDSLVASVRDFGRFAIDVDTVAPTVRPLNFSESKPLKTAILRVRIGDDLSGIATYNCFLNGSWILAEYDGKSATLVIDAKDKLKAGSNKLRVEATDAVGNATDLTFTLQK